MSGSSSHLEWECDGWSCSYSTSTLKENRKQRQKCESWTHPVTEPTPAGACVKTSVENGTLLFHQVAYFELCCGWFFHCCAWPLSSCRERGPLSGCSAQDSHCDVCSCTEHGLWVRRLQWLQFMGSAASAPGPLRKDSTAKSLGLSCFMVCGIFWDRGLNLSLLHWHVGSLPLSQQRSPKLFF